MGYLNMKLTSNRSTAHSRQGGLAMVEFVIVAPLLLMVMVGISDAGIMLYQYNSLSKAAISGARYVSGRSFSGIIEPATFDVAKRLVVNAHPISSAPIVPGLSTSAVTIVCSDGGVPVGARTRCNVNDLGVATITVSIAYTYMPVFSEAWSFFFGKGFTVPMKASVDQVLIS